MEKKKKGNWRLVLSHKAVVIPAVIIALIGLFGFVVFGVVSCANGALKGPQEKVIASTPSPSPTASPIPDRVYDLEGPLNFDPDLEQMPLLLPYYVAEGTGEPEADLMADFEAKNWIDTTPEDAPAGCQIIRHRGVGTSYLIYQGVYYNLDDDRNETGVVDLLFFDVNEDGTPELIYTVSEDFSTDARCRVGMFDFADLTRSFSDFSVMEGYLALQVNEDGCEVYRTRISQGEFGGGYTLLLGEKLGVLIAVDGRLSIELL